jgi:hypothetical protein
MVAASLKFLALFALWQEAQKHLRDRLATDVPARVAYDESRHFHQSGPRSKRRSINRAHHVGNKAPDAADSPAAR